MLDKFYMVLASTTTGGTTTGNPVTKLIDLLVSFIAPIYVLVVGGVAATFLMRRQLRPFFQFMILAVLVGIFVFNPSALSKLAVWAGNQV